MTTTATTNLCVNIMGKNIKRIKDFYGVYHIFINICFCLTSQQTVIYKRSDGVAQIVQVRQYKKEKR